MTGLLDTCTFLWLTAEPGRLSQSAKDFIDSESNELILSHVSVWEVHLKCHKGKLKISGSLKRWFTDQMGIWGVRSLPISIEHIYRTNEIPSHHDDPFDRLIIAQCLENQLPILTPDSIISEYPVDVVW